MKRIFLYSVFLLLTCFAFLYAQQSAPAGLTEFISEEGGFSVRMPGKPQETIQQVDSADGPLEMHRFALDVGENGYIVLYNDYSDPVTSDEIEKILDAVRDGGAKYVSGKVVSEKAVKLKNYSGRSVRIESNEVIYIDNFYLVGQRLYQVIFGMPKGGTMPAEAKEFMESFQIKK
jgi:hypothetical protein